MCVIQTAEKKQRNDKPRDDDNQLAQSHAQVPGPRRRRLITPRQAARNDKTLSMSKAQTVAKMMREKNENNVREGRVK